MIKKIKGIKIELIIISIALFVLGLFLTIFPEVSQIIICRAVGIALCVWGVLRLMTYFRMSREDVFVSFSNAWNCNDGRMFSSYPCADAGNTESSSTGGGR